MQGCKYQLKDYSGAVDDYTQAIILDPDFSETYYQRAYAYIEIKNFDKAIEDYKMVLELDPSNSRIPGKIATVKVQAGDFSGAIADSNSLIIKDLDKAIEIEPEYAEAYYQRALVRDSLNDKDGSVSDFQKADELGYIK